VVLAELLDVAVEGRCGVEPQSDSRSPLRCSSKASPDTWRVTQSAVAKLEGQNDAKESMIDRYATAIGVVAERRVVAGDHTGAA
jgi:hypothetical protein